AIVSELSVLLLVSFAFVELKAWLLHFCIYNPHTHIYIYIYILKNKFYSSMQINLDKKINS
ncbi:hypothetical protein ACMBCM_08610, partial [Spiroplasma sp. K1]